jgi:hypothetical protein
MIHPVTPTGAPLCITDNRKALEQFLHSTWIISDGGGRHQHGDARRG